MNKKVMYRSVKRILEENEEYKKAAEILDYCLESTHACEYLDDDYIRTLHAQVEEGGSEGIYVDLIAETLHERMRIATWKTLYDGPDAYQKMGTIAGLATWAAYKAWREAA